MPVAPERRAGSIPCTCLTCGTAFSIIPAKAAAGDGKYCSVPCRAASAGYRRQVRAALPGTIADIVKRTGVAIDTVRDQLVGLQKRGEAHVARLVDVPTAERGRGTPKFALWFESGPGFDPDMPLNPRAALAYMNKLVLLKAMPGSQSELVKRTGHSQGGASRMVGELHAAGKCHIVRWRRAKAGPAIPVYAAGAGVDKPCNVVPMTSTERSRRYMKKLERRGGLPELHARWAAAARQRNLIKRGDPLVAALFGRAPGKDRA